MTPRSTKAIEIRPRRLQLDMEADTSCGAGIWRSGRGPGQAGPSSSSFPIWRPPEPGTTLAEYQEILPFRLASSRGEAILVDGFEAAEAQHAAAEPAAPTRRF